MDNVENAFYVGEAAWHGKGTVLQSPPTIAEALRLSGLDWTVSGRSLYLLSDDGIPIALGTGHQAIVRDSDGSHLGCVGKGYQPIQNAKAFEPFQPLLDSGLVDLEAAGSLREGRRVWILGKIVGAQADVLPGDSLRGYVVFYNSHDGSLKAAYQRTAIRVVCDNTIQAAANEGQAGHEARILIRHTGDVNGRVDDITERFRNAAFSFSEEVERYRQLTRLDIGSDANLERYFDGILRIHERKERTSAAQVLGLSHEKEAVEIDVGRKQKEELRAAFEEQPGASLGSGTMWQAYNAVTYWVDHVRGRSEENRLNASWFGDGPRIRDRAMSLALAA